MLAACDFEIQYIVLVNQVKLSLFCLSTCRARVMMYTHCYIDGKVVCLMHVLLMVLVYLQSSDFSCFSYTTKDHTGSMWEF